MLRTWYMRNPTIESNIDVFYEASTSVNEFDRVELLALINRVTQMHCTGSERSDRSTVVRMCGVERQPAPAVGRLICVLVFMVSMTAPLTVHAADAIERSGDVLALALPVAAFAASLTENDREGTWQFVKAGLISQGVVHTLKRTIDRSRPDGGRHSFPSGHTSSAFVGAGFVHMRYGLKYAWPMYIAAGYVGFTRVDSNRHHQTDIAAGAAISMLTCVLIVSPYLPGIEATPVISAGTCGLRIALKI